MKIVINVKGMTCAACVNTIKKALELEEGVNIAIVALLMESATIDYDETVTTPEHLAEAIEDVGFEATVSACICGDMQYEALSGRHNVFSVRR